MNFHVDRRLLLVAAIVGAVGLFAIGFFVALGVRAVVAGPGAAPAAAPAWVGHTYDQIVLPGGTWPGLDADLLDGAEASALEESAEIDADIAAHASDPSAHHTKTTDASEIVSGTMSPDRIVGTAWTALNDGPGSGLDADTLDGLHANQIQDADDYVSSAGALSRLGFRITAVDSAGWFGWYTSVAVGADGLPLISYYDIVSHDLKVAHCGNAACTAGNTITTVDSAGNVGNYTSVTVGADGLPLISYADYTNYDLKVAHCGNAACTAGNTITTVDSAGVVGQYTSATVGADGLPLISYYDYTNGDLKVAHCGNAACTSGNTITTVDSAGNVGNYTSVTVGADGLPLISYADYTNHDLKVAHCGNAACSAGNTITTVDSAGNVGQNTSVTVATDGLPLISYYDYTNHDLKVAHCGNAACSAGNTITTVDSAGNVGLYTSVTVGADGLPLISYHMLYDLKVAHCGNAACTARNTITTVDSAGDVGLHTSVTVGADGLPLISYYDYTNHDLKVAHCSNRFCVPYHRPR